MEIRTLTPEQVDSRIKESEDKMQEQINKMQEQIDNLCDSLNESDEMIEILEDKIIDLRRRVETL